MKFKKVLLSVIITIAVLCNTIAVHAVEADKRDWDSLVKSSGQLKDSAVSSAGASIVVDAKSGRILFENHANNTMQPASITKIMTAVVAIENTDLNTIVTIDNVMADLINNLDEDAALCGFQKKESVTVEELLYGLMLLSGADASIALAVHVGGTYENFIDMMNVKAEELGMTKTNYKNPHGLYQSGHVTSAADMARLGVYANKLPEFVKIVGTARFTPTDTDKNPYSEQGYIWRNSNKLITNNSSWGYDYATGVKTGFTTPAQHTLVSSAEKGEQALVAVVLHDTSNGKWRNSITLFEYAFDYYDTIDLSALFGEIEITADVENAASKASGNKLIMQIAPIQKAYLTEFKEKAQLIRENPEEYFVINISYYEEPLIAPIKKGDIIGTITYTYTYTHDADSYLYSGVNEFQKETIFEASLIASNTIDSIPAITPEPTEAPVPTLDPLVTPNPQEEISQKVGIAFAFIGGTLLLFILIMIFVVSISRRHKYQQYSKRKKIVSPKHKEKKKRHNKESSQSDVKEIYLDIK